MTVWEVKDYLAQLTEWTSDDEEKILSLCKSALKEIEARLKATADQSDIRIASAGAALAYYKLILKQSYNSNSEEITSFKAGDVSITQSSANKSKQLENAEKLYKEALDSIIPLCQDNGFAFENVLVKVSL